MQRLPPATSLIFDPPPALPPAARRLLTLGAVGVHAALVLWLLQGVAARPVRVEAPVLTVDLIAPTLRVSTPPPPAPPAPAAVPVAVPRPPVAATPLPSVAERSPAPAVAAAAPAAPAASAPPSPPAPPEAATPVVLAAAPAPAAPPAPARELPPSAVAYRDPPAPVYPRASRRAGEAGLVVVRVFVDESGQPRAVQLAQSSGHVRLDAAATEAVLQARFHPPTDQGRPTAGWARIPIPFTLETLP